MFQITVSEAPGGLNKVKVIATEREVFDLAINTLKSSVPEGARRFDPEEKVWYVRRGPRLSLWLEHIKGVGFVIEYQDAFTFEQSAALASDIKTKEAACKTLYVLPNAPIEVVKAAYGALARKYHPDTAEDGQASPAMLSEVQTAYKLIKGET